MIDDDYIVQLDMERGVGTHLARPSSLIFSNSLHALSKSWFGTKKGVWMRYKSNCFNPSYEYRCLVCAGQAQLKFNRPRPTLSKLSRMAD